MASGDGLPTPVKLIVLVGVLVGLVWVASTLSRSIGNKIVSRGFELTPAEATAAVSKECLDLAKLRGQELLSNTAPAEASTAKIEVKACPSDFFGSMNLIVVDDKAIEEGHAKEFNILHLFGFPALYMSSTAKLPPQPKPEPDGWDDW